MGFVENPSGKSEKMRDGSSMRWALQLGFSPAANFPTVTNHAGEDRTGKAAAYAPSVDPSVPHQTDDHNLPKYAFATFQEEAP
jgi:hypothetical protein